MRSDHAGRAAARLYYDPAYGASFWYPARWKQLRLPASPHVRAMFGLDERNGVVLEGYRVRDKKGALLQVLPDHLSRLEEYVRSAILRLPGARILAESTASRGRALGFEKVYTFHDGDRAWKKRGLFLFLGSRQVNLLAQAESPAMFDLLGHEFELAFSKLEVSEPRAIEPQMV